MKNALGLFLLRVGTSLFMIPHGLGKWERLNQAMESGEPVRFLDFLGLGTTFSICLAILGELIAPIFLILGFKTRWAAIPAAITMLVAGFIAHGGDPLGEKEHSLLYAIGFIAVFLLGPGKFSVDQWLNVRKS